MKRERTMKFEKTNKMNVKLKNLNVMKRILFTLMAMVALVLVANTTFAANTKLTPAVGSTWNYAVGGMGANEGDLVAFKVTTSTTDPTASAVATSIAELANNDVLIATGAASTDVIWKDATTTYYLWVTVTDNAGTTPTGCSNHRYITITPEANTFDVLIFALGTSDQAIIPGWSTNTTDLTESCPVFVGADFEKSGGNDDGDSYVFFRVEREVANASSTWSFEFDETTDLASEVDYYDATTGWTNTYTEGSTITIPAGEDEVLIRVLLANDATSTQTLTGVIDAGVETVGLIADVDGTNNSKSTDVSTMPDLGSGTFN